MPATLSYPGVYIEELPSGVRTITGVATSLAAFVGRTLKGVTDEPVTIHSYADFERAFGGLWNGSALGFAVRDFYLNGGSQAIVVRLYRAESGGGAKPARASLDANGLNLEAATPGAWGNNLRARVDTDVSADVATALGVATNALFNLTIRDTQSGVEEQFRNVTVAESARRVDRILTDQSRLMRVKGALPGSAPTAHAAPAAGKTIWTDDNASDPVLLAAQASDGLELNSDAFIGTGKQAAKQGLYALEKVDLYNLLCIPPYKSAAGVANQDVDTGVVGAAASYCESRRAVFLLDSPSGWTDKAAARTGMADPATHLGTRSRNAAVYFPRIKAANPLRGNQVETFPACGAVAGVISRTDANRGVWKAPAGIEAGIHGVAALATPLTDPENGELNPLGLNCLRAMPAAGPVVWGARTLQGDDRLASEWKYLPVRRLALYLEESLYRGTQWVVFEPNDEPLWAQIRLNVGAFMHGLFRQGAFQGVSPREAYLVKCDRETTTQDDINRGVVNILVGFAPLKPAEFVVLKIQQLAGQTQA